MGWFYLYNLIKSAFDTDPVTSKYSLSIVVFNAEIPLLIGPNEKRHSRGTSFQTQSNNNRLKQLLSAVPSIIYQKLYPLDNVWLFKQTPSGLLQSNALGETQAWKVRRESSMNNNNSLLNNDTSFCTIRHKNKHSSLNPLVFGSMLEMNLFVQHLTEYCSF